MEDTTPLTAASVAASLAHAIQEAEQTPVAPIQPADVSFLRDPTPWDPMLMAQLLHASSLPGVWPGQMVAESPAAVPAAAWPTPSQGAAMPDFQQQFAAAYTYLTPTPKQRAPRRKRARILREGQLTMIVYGANEALKWARRIAEFTSVMRGVLGDRRRTFTWSGSVMDSVVGAFLTQNVSDSLSARAYMEVTSRWPSPAALASRTDTADWEAVRVAPPEELMEAIKCRGLHVLLTTNIQAFLNHVRNYSLLRRTPHWAGLRVSDDVMAVMGDVLEAVEGCAVGAAMPEVEQMVGEMLDAVAASQAEPSRERRTHVELAYEEEGVLKGLDTLATAAAATELLSLEWLRQASDEEAREFLMGINGLGRKSVACIMLLTLGKKEFPVDTNVGRICSRLGWIPLDAAQAIEDLDDYAPEPEVHAYLRSRLLGFDIETLYELHYQMITLGKVFCTKQNPNCKSCPMNASCEYAQHNGPSLHGRKRVRVASAGDPFASLAPTSPTQGADLRPKRMHWKTIQKMERLAREAEELELARAQHLQRFSSAPLEYLVAMRSPRPRTPGLRRPRGTERDPVPPETRQATEMAAQAALSALWFKYRPPRWLPIHLIRAAVEGLLPDSVWDSAASDENAGAWLKAAAEEARAAPMTSNPLREIEVPDEVMAQHVLRALQGSAGPAAWEVAHVPPLPPVAAEPAPPPLVLKSKPVAVEAVSEVQQETVETLAPAAAAPEAPMEVEAEQPAAAAAPQEQPEQQQQQGEDEAMDFVPDEEMYAADAAAADMEHAASEWGQFPFESAAEELLTADDDGGGGEASAAAPASPSSAIEAECARLQALAREMAEENVAMAKVTEGSDVTAHRQRLLDLSLQVLNIDASLSVESAEEVVAVGRVNYRQLARALHPDKCKLPGAADAFAGLGMAMNIVNEFAGASIDQAAAASTAPPATVASTAPEDHTAWNTSRLVVIAHVLPARLHACFPHLNPDGYRLGPEQVLFLPVDNIPTFSREIVAGRAAPASALADLLGGSDEAAADDDAFVDGMLLVGCRAALRERFPLNGTYFQINEVFVDDTTAAQPVRLPRAELGTAERLPLYFGLGIHYMSKAMTQEEVTFMFARGRVCFRAFDPRTRAPVLLPKFLMPSIPTNSKSTWRNKKEREAARMAKAAETAMRSGLPLVVPPPAPGMRLLRVPLSSDEVVPPPAALTDGQNTGRLSLEVTASPPLPMLMGPVPTTPPAAAKKRPSYHDAYSSIETETYAQLGPGHPKSQELADRKSGKGQPRRRMLAPIIKASQRCGTCKACLNPGWKKACETRRAEQLGFQAGQQQVFWAAAAQAAAQAAQAAACAAAMAQVTGASQEGSVPSDSATVQLMPPPPPPVVLPAATDAEAN